MKRRTQSLDVIQEKLWFLMSNSSGRTFQMDCISLCVSIFWPLCNLVYSRPVNGAAINMHFSSSQDKFTSDFMETYFWTVKRWELPKRDWCTCAPLNFQNVFISHCSKNSSVNMEKKNVLIYLQMWSRSVSAQCALVVGLITFKAVGIKFSSMSVSFSNACLLFSLQ